jgi:sarcosine oxidase subunit beta
MTTTWRLPAPATSSYQRGEHHSMDRTADVIVIGGGISGTATAYELAKRGIAVTLLERESIASMASGWTLAGVRQSGRHVAELPLAAAAVRRWENLAEELGADVEYRQHGNLRLARTEDEIPVIQQVVADGQAIGLPIEYLDGADTVREIAPALSETIAGASLCATDGHANNHLAVKAFADAAVRHGANLHTGVHVEALRVAGDRVTGVRTDDGDFAADAVIVAAGIYTPRLLGPIGLHLPLRITHTPVIQTEVAEPILAPVLGVANGELAGRQEASGRFRISGRGEDWSAGQHTTENTASTLHQVQRTIANALQVLPGIAHLRVARSWGGLIDRTPDVIPVLERIPSYEGLVVGAGFSGHGFGIGPVTGEILADLATVGTTRFDLSLFTLARFADQSIPESELQLHG